MFNKGPKRPDTVPSEAVWNKSENEWELGQVNEDGDNVGEWKWWLAPKGYLVCHTFYDDEGYMLKAKRFHQNGEVSLDLDNSEDGHRIYHRSTESTNEYFPLDSSNVWTAKAKDHNRLWEGYDCYDKEGNLIGGLVNEEEVSTVAQALEKFKQNMRAKNYDVDFEEEGSDLEEKQVIDLPSELAEYYLHENNGLKFYASCYPFDSDYGGMEMPILEELYGIFEFYERYWDNLGGMYEEFADEELEILEQWNKKYTVCLANWGENFVEAFVYDDEGYFYRFCYDQDNSISTVLHHLENVEEYSGFVKKDRSLVKLLDEFLCEVVVEAEYGDDFDDEDE